MFLTHIFDISGPLNDAEKIVVCVKDQDGWVCDSTLKGKTLLGSIRFTGLAYTENDDERRPNFRAFNVINGRKNICEMHVSFKITTTKLTNKKEQLVNIEVHIKDQKKVFSHLFKVFLNRRLAIMSINAIGSLKDREEDVELKEVEASEQQPSSPESDSDSSSDSDDWPSPRPSTSASVLPEAGSPALNSSIDLDNTASAKKVKMTGKGRKRFADELRAENKRLRAENDELRAEVVPDRFPRLANELEMREEEREKQRNRQKMKWLVDHVKELTTKVKKLTTMVNDLTKMREVDNYNRKKEASGVCKLPDENSDNDHDHRSDDEEGFAEEGCFSSNEEDDEEDDDDQKGKNPDVESEKQKRPI